MLDFNANESYRLSICVDKSVFSTIETAQCDVQFYLVNSLLSKCLGMISTSCVALRSYVSPTLHIHCLTFTIFQVFELKQPRPSQFCIIIRLRASAPGEQCEPDGSLCVSNSTKRILIHVKMALQLGICRQRNNYTTC